MKWFRIPVYLRVALLYMLFGGLWILLSDRLLDLFVHDPDVLTRIQTYKGWGFVIASAALIYFLLRNDPHLRRQVEAALQESEARYQNLFEASNDAILLGTPEGQILGANPAACHIFGRTEAELKALGRAAILDSSDPRVEAAFQDRARTGSFTSELTLIRKDGSTFPAEISSSLYRDREGHPRTSMIIRDIRERKQADRALRESEARFSTVFQSSPIGISITRIADGCYIDVNREYEKISGYSRDELIGKTTSQLYMWVNPKDRERLLSELDARGRMTDYETQSRRKSGEVRNTLISAELIELAGERCILSLTRDITEGKRAEAKIERQYQHLASLSAIDSVITSSFDLNLTLDIFLERVLSQLQVDAAAVLLLRPGLNSLEFAAGRGFRGSGINRLRLRFGEDIAGRAARLRKLISIPDLSHQEKPSGGAELPAEEGFRSVHATPLIAKGEVKGVLEVFQRAPLFPDAEWLEFFDMLARQAAIAIDNAVLFESLQRSNNDLALAYDETIEGWSRALDLRDHETEGHTQRVTDLTVELARLVGMTEAEIAHVRYGALLHDIGKMGVPDSILLKPDRLTDEEMATMRRHPVYAFELLSSIGYLRPALDIPHYHHEKWDGSGYPDGLSGTAIPLAARLFAVIDVWDALGSDRPYRSRWPEAKIIDHLQASSGSHFDPQMVRVFLDYVKSRN